MRYICAVALLSGLVFSGQAAGEKKEKKEPNKAAPGAEGKMTDSARAVLDHEAAHAMIDYGRRTKSPLALLAAAQVFVRSEARDLKAKSTVENTRKGEPTRKTVAKVDNSPKGLIAEVRKMTKVKSVLALAKALEEEIAEGSRGRVPGPGFDNSYVSGGYVRTYTGQTFRGGEIAIVTVMGNGGANLELEVYDDLGFLVAADRAPGRGYRVSWTPRFTGTFTIKVKNNGFVNNYYTLTTN